MREKVKKDGIVKTREANWCSLTGRDGNRMSYKGPNENWLEV
jgi:hypothetical protein